MLAVSVEAHVTHLLGVLTTSTAWMLRCEARHVPDDLIHYQPAVVCRRVLLYLLGCNETGFGHCLHRHEKSWRRWIFWAANGRRST